jgi:hypothetical protein
MTETNKKDSTPSGSHPIPVRRSEGSAGSSREVTTPDAGASCTVRDGQENTDDTPVRDKQKSKEKQKTPRIITPQLAERKTELRGLGIAPSRENKSTLRRRTEQDLIGPDPEVPYARFESAARGLVCSLMERQDRMNEEIFFKLNDLGYRQDDLEATVGDLTQKKRSG